MLAGPPAFHQYSVGLQKVFRRVMLAMLILDTLKNGELAPRSEVNLELSYAVDDVVVDAFGIAARLIKAGLPASLEDVPGIAGVRDPLGPCSSGSSHKSERDESEEIELRQAHVSPFP